MRNCFFFRVFLFFVYLFILFFLLNALNALPSALGCKICCLRLSLHSMWSFLGNIRNLLSVSAQLKAIFSFGLRNSYANMTFLFSSDFPFIIYVHNKLFHSICNSKLAPATLTAFYIHIYKYVCIPYISIYVSIWLIAVDAPCSALKKFLTSVLEHIHGWQFSSFLLLLLLVFLPYFFCFPAKIWAHMQQLVIHR